MIQRLWAHWKWLEKQTCVWQATRPASGCGNIPDCLAGLLTAVSAAILILSSNMCRKFTASFHLVTKEHSAPGFPLSPSALAPSSLLPLQESLKANELCWVRQRLLSSLSLAQGLTLREIWQVSMWNVAFTSLNCKNPSHASTEGSRSLCIQPQMKMSASIQSDFYLHNVCHPLYILTCRCICMTSGCSGRWHRCCSCQAPLHTRPHLERRKEEGGHWLVDEAETVLMLVSHTTNNTWFS